MLAAVISDTHARSLDSLPERCLELLGTADMIFHAGDFMTELVLDELEPLGPPVVAVHGNVDDAGLRERLPAELTVDLAGIGISVLHDAGPAAGRLERLRQRFPESRAVIYGHSHMPEIAGLPLAGRSGGEKDPEFQIFNPGSPTQRRRAPKHTMGVMKIEQRKLTFELVELD